MILNEMFFIEKKYNPYGFSYMGYENKWLLNTEILPFVLNYETVNRICKAYYKENKTTYKGRIAQRLSFLFIESLDNTAFWFLNYEECTILMEIASLLNIPSSKAIVKELSGFENKFEFPDFIENAIRYKENYEPTAIAKQNLADSENLYKAWLTKNPLSKIFEEEAMKRLKNVH